LAIISVPAGKTNQWNFYRSQLIEIFSSEER